jgi:DNA-binding CsgD family transcriptional regulator/tetratricopeptide (TPR) repeat protein
LTRDWRGEDDRSDRLLLNRPIVGASSSFAYGAVRKISHMVAPGVVGMFERELETSHLHRAVDHSFHGVGRLVVIEGPTGIGKTSLLAVARDLAREAGMNVRGARGAELEQTFPFGVIRQLFDPLFATASEAERGEWLSGAAELAAPLFDAHGALSDAGEDTIYPRLHGLYWLCSNLARAQPLALLIDDAQSADEPSLAFLGFLARRLEELPVLLVVAVRSVDLGAPDALLALRADPAARILTPRGLSTDTIERMLVERIGGRVEEQFVNACHAATAGNPFLLGELVLALQGSRFAPVAANASAVSSVAPQRVADAVLARLGRLSPEAPRLAYAVAILGDGASLGNAAALAGLDERTALRAAAAMRTSDLFSDQAGLSFAHPIIRAAIYQSLHPAERGLRHADAARLLYDRGAPPEQVAAQILLTGELTDPWVLDQLQHAASSALAMGAPRNAVAYLRRALEVPEIESERGSLLAQLGRAEMLSGLPEAADHLEEAVRLTTDRDEHARVAIMLAQLLKYTGRVPRAVELLSGIPPAHDQTLNERAQTEMLSGALMSHPAHQQLADRIGRLEDRGGHAESDRERLELIVLAFEGMNVNRPRAELIDLLTRARPDPDSQDYGALLPPGVMTAAATFTYLDEFDQADKICTSVVERSRRRGALAALLIALSMRAQIEYRRGDLEGTLADASAAFALATEVTAISAAPRLHPLAMINFVAVEQQRSEAELQELLETTDDSLHRDMRHTLHGALTVLSYARLLLALGRADEALDQLLELGALPATFATRAPAFLAWRSDAALIMHQLGDQPGAQRLAAEELELAQQMGTARGVGIALRTTGIIRPEPAIDVLNDAVRVLKRSAARLEQARALVDLGSAMRNAGERSAARKPLREGHDKAVLCGATKLAERARQEIAASGARSSVSGLSGVAALTPSERRVAELAVQGQTNRDIAQALFVTEKTVETHLGHVYDKLGVRSRRKLGEVLPQPEVVEV